MTRLTPVLEKLSAKQKNRKQSEVALNKFVASMLAIVESDLTDEGCSIRIVNKSFADENRELQLMVLINFPTNLYDKPISYILQINKHEEMYKLSSGDKLSTPLITTPEQAANNFFAILEEIV